MALNYLYFANNRSTDGIISQVESKGVISDNYTYQTATTTVDGVTFNTDVRFLLNGGRNNITNFTKKADITLSYSHYYYTPHDTH